MLTTSENDYLPNSSFIYLLNLRCHQNGSFPKQHSSTLDVYGVPSNLVLELYHRFLDKNAIKFVRNNFNANIFEGLLDEANYESNFFDFIHVSHVIEHVSDLNLFLNELRRILKPNGFLSIGTPDISSNLYKIHKVVRHLQLKVPDIIDGVEHTFLFSKNTLRKICEEHEFEIIDQFSEKIGESFIQIFKYNMPYSKKIKRLIQSFFNINQWIILKK